jgi:integrase
MQPQTRTYRGSSVRKPRTAIDLPKGVQRVVSRGREYFYYQSGRGTAAAGERVALPSDPRSPEFWVALRAAQGGVVTDVPTVSSVIDQFLTSTAFKRVSAGTQDQYERALRYIRTAWGDLPAAGVRPVHAHALMDGLSDTPGKANNVLSALRALSTWALGRDLIPNEWTKGVTSNRAASGHKPWTDEQIAAAHEHLTGMVRRGVMLALYTGQRGSDVVRMGWTDVDGDGGVRVIQQKTKVELWCPILPELAAEMATWEKRPGPFMVHERGAFTRKIFDKHFARQRDKVLALKGVTLHGLRATAVVRLRMAGVSHQEIQALVGMSMQMVIRYSRYADRKASSQAAVVRLDRERGLKNLENQPKKKG